MAVDREEFEELQKRVEFLQENLSILSDQDLLKQIMEARERKKSGEGISLDDARNEMNK
jgi:hypothetical protein